MRNKTKAFLMQLPALILLITAAISSWVIKIRNLYQISWATPIALTIIVVLYFWGRRIAKRASYDY